VRITTTNILHNAFFKWKIRCARGIVVRLITMRDIIYNS